MSTTNGGCCDEETTQEAIRNYNPSRRRGRRKAGKLQIFDLKNPLPKEVDDPSHLKDLFQKWNLIPYAGSTKESGHTLLYLQLALAQLSPTHGTAINKLNKYAFGSRATFVWSENPEYNTGEQAKEMTPETAKVYEEALMEYVNFKGGVIDMHRHLGWSLKATGNGWSELVISQVQGQTRCAINYHKPTHCLYKNTKPGEARIVGISPIWTEDYLMEKDGPRWVPLYPNFVQDKDGNYRTMFHLKEGQNDWYGRPDTEPSTYPMAIEAQNYIYLYKQLHSNFSGQLIIEVEDGDANGGAAIDDKAAQENGFDTFADEFKENFSMMSDDPQAVLLTSRATGSRPMFVFQVKPNTNQEWYKVIGEDVKGAIIRAHGCTLRWMGNEAANGFSTDAFVDDYVFNQEPTEDEFRRKVCVFTNRILTAVWEHLGLQNYKGVELNKISLTFSSPIKAKVEEYKQSRTNANTANNTNTVGSDPVQPGRQGLPDNPRA